MALNRLTQITSSGISSTSTITVSAVAGSITGVVTATSLTVTGDVTSGMNVSGIVTATTVQVGSATTIHTTGIDLGSGNITSHNINSTGIITSTSFVGPVTGNVTGNLTGNVTGNVTGNLTGDVTGDLTGNVTGNLTGNVTGNVTGNLTGDVTGDLTGNVTGNVSSSGANTLGSLTVTNDATVGGALTVTGDLTVNGTTTTIDTAVTAVDSLAIDGNAIIDGSIGIGTDTPDCKLEISNDGYAFPSPAGSSHFRVGNGGGSATIDIAAANTQVSGIYFSDTDAVARGVVGYHHNGNYLYFGTNDGTKRLRITSNGLVGIGTDDTPTAKLDVFEAVTSTQTAIRIGNTNTPSTANNKRLEFVDGTGTTEGTNKFTYGYIQGYREGGSNAGALIFGTKPDNAGSPAEKFRITSSGKVGIGTNNPGDLLTLYGTDPSIKLQDSSGDAFSLIEGDNTDEGSLRFRADPLSAGANTHIRFDTDGSERLRITSDGTFYLGGYLEATTNNNTVKKIAVAPYNWTGGSTAEIASIEMGAPNTGSDDGNIIFKTATNVDTGGTLDERLRISSNGKIHIGYDASSSAGTEQVNIVAAGGGINICRTQGGSPAINEWLGALGFKGYASGNSSSGADARIHAKAAAAHSGTSAAADLIFSTKPTTTGPGSAPTERMSITAAGQIRTGQININAFSNEDNSIGGYAQFACDNHANTFFGQNLKLGASAGSGSHTLEVINQHSSIGGAGMYIGGNQNTSGRTNAVTFYAVAANQSAGTDVTNMDRLRITDSHTYFWTQPTNYNSSAQTYIRTFGFTFNMADGEEEVMFYNPDGYRRIYYQIYIQSGHGSNGYGYILCNTSRYGTDFHVVDWHVSLTTYAHASSVNGNVNYNGLKLVRNGTYGTITYYVIVKAFSPAGGNPFSTSGLTDASYRYFSQGF